MQNQHFLYKKLFLSGILLLNGCQGNYFLKSSPCPDGKIRKNGTCIQSGKNFENCVDPDLKLIPKSASITLCNGEIAFGIQEELKECSKDLELSCLANEKFPSADIMSVSAADISYGEKMAGYTGALRAIKRCKNYAETSISDTSNPPSNIGNTGQSFAPAAVNTGTNVITIASDKGLYQNLAVKITSSGTMPSPLVSGQVYYVDFVTVTTFRLLDAVNGNIIDISTQGTGSHSLLEYGDGLVQSWDTLGDFVSGLNRYPANNPWGTDEYKCDQTNFSKINTNSPPLKPTGAIPTNGSHPFTEIWQDNLTGMYFTNVLYRGSGSNQWVHMVEICKSIDNQNAGSGWRLPTGKEILHLYVNGVANVSELNWSNGFYITSTKSNQDFNYNSYVIDGTLDDWDSKSSLGSNYLFCVR